MFLQEIPPVSSDINTLLISLPLVKFHIDRKNSLLVSYKYTAFVGANG